MRIHIRIYNAVIVRVYTYTHSYTHCAREREFICNRICIESLIVSRKLLLIMGDVGCGILGEGVIVSELSYFRVY